MDIKHEKSKKLLLITVTSLAVSLVVFVAALLSQEVESDATILDLFSGERTQTARFSDMLVRLGHEKPRPYRLNGNNVFISVRHSFKPPLELIEEYQVALTAEGLNNTPVFSTESAVLLDKINRGEQVKGIELQDVDNVLNALKGGLVPVEVSENYVRMVGGEPATEVSDISDLVGLMANFGPEGAFKAVRTIEMFKRSNNDTEVVASFSDDKLDIKKMYKSKSGNSIDSGRFHENLPACPSCVRIQQFEDLDPDSSFIGNVYVSSHEPDEIISYYDQVYKNRGWRQGTDKGFMERLVSVNNVPKELQYHRQYVKDGGEVVSLTLTPYFSDATVYVDLKYFKDNVPE